MENKIFPHTVSQSLGLIFFSFILATPIYFLVTHYFTQDLPQEVIMTGAFILIFLMFIGFTHLMNFRYKIKPVYQFNITHKSLLPLLTIVILTFQMGLNTLAIKSLNAVFGRTSSLENPLEAIIISLGALMLAPILEEIFFRGIILKGILTSYHPRKAIIISAIIFAVFHLNPTQIFGALVLGLLFGWVYYKTNSLGLTIILHFFTNLSGLLHGYIKYSFPSIYGNVSIYIISICSIVSAIAFYRLYSKMKIVNMGTCGVN